MASLFRSHSNKEMEIETPVGGLPNWEEIERSESLLVCAMYEEATSLASSILSRLCDKKSTEEIEENIVLEDMLVSAGMVFVQSLNPLGRTLEIIPELVQLYGSLTSIPSLVLLTGVCFQMQEDPHGVKKYLEEFLDKWRFVDEGFYVLSSLEKDITCMEGISNRFALDADTYLQFVDIYVTILLDISKDIDLATPWVEKAALSDQMRQKLLRRIHSAYSSKATSSQASASALMGDESVNSKQIPKSEKLPVGDPSAKQAILKYSRQHASPFWWFRTVNLKFGSIQFPVSNGSVLLATLVLVAYYFMRRKKYTLTRIIKGQALLLKKAVMDVWQLAFSYQVNPLAAVEPLHNVTRGSR